MSKKASKSVKGAKQSSKTKAQSEGRTGRTVVRCKDEEVAPTASGKQKADIAAATGKFTLEKLRRFVDLFDTYSENKTAKEGQIAAKMAVKPNTITGRKQEFEKAFGVPLIPLNDGMFEPTAELREVIRNIRAGLGHIQKPTSSWNRERIEIGVSQGLTPYLAPEIVRQFVSKKSLEDPGFGGRFEIVIRHDQPHNLIRSMTQATSDDFVITSCRDPVMIENTECKSFSLPMFLLIDRRQPMARVNEKLVSWDHLREHKVTLMLQALDRDPLPNYPEEVLALPHVRCNSYFEAYATVLGGSPMACIGFPQLLDPYQQARLRAFGGGKLKLSTMPVQLVRRTGDRSAAVNEIIGELFEAFRKQLKAAEEYGEGTTLGAKLRNTWFVAQTDSKTYNWHEGQLADVIHTSNGYFSADHTTLSDDPHAYVLTGRISINESGEKPVYHIMWRGRFRHGDVHRQDSYAVSIIATEAELQSGPLVGCWIGRAAALSKYRPDVGFFIVDDFEKTLASQYETYKVRCEKLKQCLRWDIPQLEPSVPAGVSKKS